MANYFVGETLRYPRTPMSVMRLVLVAPDFRCRPIERTESHHCFNHRQMYNTHAYEEPCVDTRSPHQYCFPDMLHTQPNIGPSFYNVTDNPRPSLAVVCSRSASSEPCGGRDPGWNWSPSQLSPYARHLLGIGVLHSVVDPARGRAIVFPPVGGPSVLARLLPSQVASVKSGGGLKQTARHACVRVDRTRRTPDDLVAECVFGVS